jgi:hypothetical protein
VLLTNWYACDQKIHGELKQHAEAESLAHPGVEWMKQLGGNYSGTPTVFVWIISFARV